jgi:mono/diheme cytochrome c family protein
MKFRISSALALAASVLTSCAQTNADVRRAEQSPAPVRRNAGPAAANAAAGRTLFLKNCAHCHGANARGDDGPDLHNLDVSDQWIANRIRSGKKGQMTAFAGKLQPADIDALIVYLCTLK